MTPDEYRYVSDLYDEHGAEKAAAVLRIVHGATGAPAPPGRWARRRWTARKVRYVRVVAAWNRWDAP